MVAVLLIAVIMVIGAGYTQPYIPLSIRLASNLAKLGINTIPISNLPIASYPTPTKDTPGPTQPDLDWVFDKKVVAYTSNRIWKIY